MKLRYALVLLSVLAACPPPGGPGTRQPGGVATVQPDKCGALDGSKVARKVYAFLQASAELDRATSAMESNVADSCKTVASILGVPAIGSTADVCKAALAALDANLKVSVRTESRLVTRTTPPVCSTDIDFAAGITAECEASVAADVNVSCEGSCSGTCNGTCDGTCASGGGGGACAGECDGTCRGDCSGSCQGYADVSASADCKAAVEIRTNVRTTCTEPKVEVVREDVAVVDDTQFQLAMQAINAGLPGILRSGAQAQLAAKALVNWGTALGGLIRSGGDLIEDLGAQTVCVADQVSIALSGLAAIQARVDVSIQVSASFSASAGVQ